MSETKPSDLGVSINANLPDPPTDEQRDRLAALLKPLTRITQPKTCGIEHLPPGGALLVGNHTLYAFLDLPFFMAELWNRERVAVRALGDHAHYNFPIWRDVLELCGMVRGTRDNVHALMEAGEKVLVFPGGAREVNKRRGEKYQIMWKERLGFVQLAVEHAYPIVPFAAVGAEEMFDILIDEDNPMYGRFAAAVKRLTGWPVQPLVRGIGPTPIPRPERLYFWFGEPVETDSLRNDPTDRQIRRLRDVVRREVEGGIAFLLDQRENDPLRSARSRLLRSP